jgi:hypothetical protein
MEGHCFLRAFEIKRYINRYVKMSCKRLSLSIGALLGKLEGIHLLGRFERNGKCIWVPFLDPEDIKILSLGAIWNFGIGTGLS